MANLWQNSTDISLAQEAAIGLILAAAQERSIPARPWPLAAAMQDLARTLPAQSPFTDACPSKGNPTRKLEDSIRMLVNRGHAIGSGRGVEAVWIFQERWVEGWATVLDGLDETDRNDWSRAAQVLTSCLSIWAKSVCAARSAVSASTGGHPAG